MSETFKAFLKELDLPEDLAEKPIDEVKTKFHEEFVARKIADSDPDIVNRITGSRLGKITNFMKQNFAFEEAEVKDKTLEDVIGMAAKKVKSEMDTLKAQLEGKNPDAKEWENKIKGIQDERDKFKKMAEDKEQEFEGFRTQALTEQKNLKLGYALNGLRSKIEWSEQATDISKKGFDAHIHENYKFDFNEAGDLEVFGKDGNKIQNGKKTGFLTAEEVFKTEAQKHNLLKLTNPSPKPTPAGGPPSPETKTLNGGVVRRIAPAAVTNAQK